MLSSIEKATICRLKRNGPASKSRKLKRNGGYISLPFYFFNIFN